MLKPLRMVVHDKIGIPLVVDGFGNVGYKCHKIGTENDPGELYRALAEQDDQVALMLRFRPDLLVVKEGVESLLCEVKCELGESKNFAIEVDSYRAACMWNRASRRVVYTFVDLSKDAAGKLAVVCKGERHCYRWVDSKACWADELPRPCKILVPRRWDFDEQWARMAREWPDVEMVPIPHRAGAGTPLFLIYKWDSALWSFSNFVDLLARDNE